MTLGTQIAARLDEHDVEALDDMVASGRFSSRAEAVRTAVARFLEAERRRAVGEAIVEGYRQTPQTDADVDIAATNLRRLIAEESW